MSGNEHGCIWAVIVALGICVWLAFGDGVPGGWRVVGVLGLVITVVVVALVFISVASGNSGGATGTYGTGSYGTYTDDRGRLRCYTCRKVIYDDYEAAEDAAQNALSYGTYLRSYYETRGGHWQLSSQRPRW